MKVTKLEFERRLILLGILYMVFISIVNVELVNGIEKDAMFAALIQFPLTGCTDKLAFKGKKSIVAIIKFFNGQVGTIKSGLPQDKLVILVE